MTDETRQSRCGCCDGTRKTNDIVGSVRPCSRCDVEGFERWSKERRPDAEQLTNSDQPEGE